MPPPIDYLRVLRSLPGPVLVLRPDPLFTVVDANDAYLQIAHITREGLVGRALFEVFPDNPDDPNADGVAKLRLSLETVLATRAPHRMATQRYDVRRADGAFEIRWWNPLNSPVLSPSGEVELLIHCVEEATEIRRKLETSQQSQSGPAMEILDSIAEGFFAIDRDWRFTYINREGEKILGLAREELVGRNMWEAYPGVESTDFALMYRAAMDERLTSTVTAHYPDHERWYEARAYPAPQGISVYFRDVSAEKMAEEERERLTSEADRQRRIYETALSNTPDLIYIFDREHRFVYANKTLLEMWGVSREHALGKTCLELGYADWHAAMHDREIEEVVATRRPIRGEVPFTGAKGRQVWDYIFAPVFGPEGDVVAIAGTSRDTTERRQHEEAIAGQAVRLQEADRAKDEFLATLSHELRNPLAPLRNSVALLRMAGNADERTTRIHEMMERQVNHLVRLVGDLLEISRITRGDFALKRERVQMSAIVRNAIETAEPVVQSRKHQLNVSLPEDPVWVDVDPVRVAQIVANLIDNAAKYTPERGRIDLVLRRLGPAAEVRVRDNGPGIAPEARNLIFEMFNRGGRGSVQGEGGLGIGLALARRLAEMHGASLDVESDGPGKGAEFILRMPIAREARETPTAHAENASVASRRILVVDDNHDAADSLGMLLRELGADVRIAHGGPEAIEIFAEFDPSAVLLDIGMPGMNGYEVARELRRRHPARRTPLIALTGWGQQQDRDLAQQAGFDHHLVKPAEIDALRSLLSSLGIDAAA